MVCFSMFWFVLVRFGLICFVSVCLCWCVLVLYCFFYLFWFDLVRFISFGSFWFVMVWFSLFWFVLACIGLIWYVLVCFDLIWYDLVCFDLIWFVLVRFVSFYFFYRVVLVCFVLFCAIVPVTGIGYQVPVQNCEAGPYRYTWPPVQGTGWLYRMRCWGQQSTVMYSRSTGYHAYLQ